LGLGKGGIFFGDLEGGTDTRWRWLGGREKGRLCCWLLFYVAWDIFLFGGGGGKGGRRGPMGFSLSFMCVNKAESALYNTYPFDTVNLLAM